MKRVVSILCAGLAALALSLPCHALVNSGLMKTAKAAGTASLKKIKSGQGKVTVHAWYKDQDEKVYESEVEYTVTFKGDHFRLAAMQTVEGIATPYLIAYDGKSVVTYYPLENRAKIKAPRKSYLINDEWAQICLGSSGAYGPPGDNGTPAKVDGRDVILVKSKPRTLHTSDGNITMREEGTVEVNKGYTNSSLRVYISDNKHPENLMDEISIDVADFGGVWAPATVERISYRPNSSGTIRKSAVLTTTYDRDFKFNIPVDESQFKINLPTGTKVDDTQSGKSPLSR